MLDEFVVKPKGGMPPLSSYGSNRLVESQKWESVATKREEWDRPLRAMHPGPCFFAINPGRRICFMGPGKAVADVGLPPGKSPQQEGFKFHNTV
jgi:hypothetical protein